MCELVTLVMCVSLALVSTSALPADTALHDSAHCTQQCLLRARIHEEAMITKPSCNFKLFCDKLCRGQEPRLSERLLRCRPRSRRSRSPAWAEATLIAHSVGMDVLPQAYKSSMKVEPPSNLRVTSLSSQGETVDCQLTWDTRQEAGGGGWFLVTWETEAAGRGNLLTPSSPVTLTLLPANLYHVQVSPSSRPEVLLSLDVDTHLSSSSQVLPLTQEAAAGVMAASLLFLVLLLVSVTRWRSLAKSATCHQPQHFKVYSPPVTIVPVHLPVQAPCELA